MRRRSRWWLAAILAGGGSWGCGPGTPQQPAAPARPFAGQKLTVGVVGEPGLVPSIRAQRGEWAARTGADFEVRPAPDDPAAVAAAKFDVVVFPADRTGDLLDAKALTFIPDAALAPPETGTADPSKPAEKADDPFAERDLLPAYRDLVTRDGGTRIGLPLGSSALVVAYRKAALDNPAVREAAGVTPDAPRTWADFDKLAKLLHGRDLDGDGQPDHGVALAWGDDPEGVGDATWIARAAASAFHRDQFSFLLDSETTEPRVASPPFAEALQALLDLRAAGPPDAAKLDAKAARDAFRSGKVALLIDRAERAGSWGGEGQSAIGVWPLPGSGQVYDPSRQAWEDANPPSRPTYLLHAGGWLVGVSPKSAHSAAENLAIHLAGPESTDRLRAERDFPMLATRSAQLTRGLTSPRSAPAVESRAWNDAVRKTLDNERVAPGLRLPDAAGYLADLARARAAANAGTPVPEALAALDRAWRDRTKAKGEARQAWFHRRGLPGLVTAPEPPPR